MLGHCPYCNTRAGPTSRSTTRACSLHLGSEICLICQVDASIVAVIGTLLGTTLGIFGSYVTQRASHDREAAECLNSKRREVYIEWLGCVHSIYQAVKAAWGGKPLPQPEDRWRDLRAVSPTESQAALESLRLVASDRVAITAAALCRHLRQEAVTTTGAGTKDDYNAWQDMYWKLRRQFVDAARLEVGLPPLDWKAAGVLPYRMRRG